MAGARSPVRIGLPTAASLFVNGLMIAALINLGVGRQQRRAEAPAMKVMALALLKGVEDGAEEAEAAERTVPAPPSMASPPQPARPDAPLPAVQPMFLTLPAPAAASAAPAQPSPAPVAPATAASAPSAATAPPALAPAALAPKRGAADGLDAKAPPGTSRAYAARIRSWLYAHKIYPRRAKMRHEEGIVRVRFVIDRAGSLIEGRIVESSGNASLDEEANAMMRRASPYPKAPQDVAGERIEFTAPIEFILPV